MDIDKFIKTAKDYGAYSFDVEHDPKLSIHGENFELHGVSFATEGITFYERDDVKTKKIIKELFNTDAEAIAFNGKYDLKGLVSAGIITCYDYPENFVDPMVGMNLLEDNRRPNQLGLDKIVWDKYGYKMRDFKESWGTPEFTAYTCDDARFEYKLWNDIKPDLEKQKLIKLFTDILMPAEKAFADVELRGIRWDLKQTRVLLRRFQILRVKIEKEIFEEIGPLNLASGDQLAKRLFDELGYSSRGIELTKSGKRLEVGSDAMDKLARRYEVCKKIKVYRTLSKTINTSIEPFARRAMEDKNERIHSSFWIVSATGRTRSSSPNCFPGEVEILTVKGWQRFDNLDKSLKVAQYDIIKGLIEFVLPIEYIEQKYSGFLSNIKTNKQIDIQCTPNHRFFLENRKSGNVFEFQAANYPPDYKQIHAGVYKGAGRLYTESQLIIIAAYQADCHIDIHQSLDWSFSKLRKVKRFRKALIECGIVFTESKTTRNRTRFKVHKSDVPNWLKGKKFFNDWVMRLDWKCIQFLSNEIFLWDGSYTRKNCYSSNEKRNADYVQILQILSNRRARIRKYKKSNWQVDVTRRNYSLTSNVVVSKKKYEGKVYCVSVPKENIIVRYNGRVIVAGNSQNIPSPKNFYEDFKDWIESVEKDSGIGVEDLNMRTCIIPEDGFSLIKVDYSQLELRLIAHITQDKMFLDAYRRWKCTSCNSVGESETILHKCPKCGAAENEDILKSVKNVGFWHGLDLHQITTDKVIALKNDRQLGKRANFALVYFATARKMAFEYPELNQDEWQDVINDYFGTYTGVRDWHKRMIDVLDTTRICRDIFGRLRRIAKSDVIKNRKNAINMIINFNPQAAGTELAELAMGRLRKRWIDVKIWMRDVFQCLMVHDELVFEVRKGMEESTVKDIVDVMENSVKLRVPIRVEYKIVDNWG